MHRGKKLFIFISSYSQTAHSVFMHTLQRQLVSAANNKEINAITREYTIARPKSSVKRTVQTLGGKQTHTIGYMCMYLQLDRPGQPC